MGIRVYSLSEIVAEKLRALLQQVIRNRNRRQDVFDIAWLLKKYGPDSIDKDAVLNALMIKARARGIEPTRTSLENPDVVRRAEADWDSMSLEIAGKLPSFKESFDAVNEFYKSLPWK